MGMWVRLGLLLALAGLVFVAAWGANASPGITERVSVDSAGAEATGDSGAWGRPAMNSDGRFVAFESFATDLVSGDTNSASDIFVRDREMATTSRVSLDSGGSQADGFSFQPTISGDGRYVAFESDATNLVSGDTNAANDIFVRDRQAETTTRVSVATGGAQADGPSFQPAISNDGRYVAFYSEATNLVSGDTNVFCDTDGDTQYDDNCPDVFVRDRDTDEDGVPDEAGAVSTTRVSVASGGAQANGASVGPAISGDGRYVAFYSEATNLVTGDGNGTWDVFVRDWQLEATERVSVDSGGSEGNGLSYDPAVNWDGRFVAFASAATNLVTGDTNSAVDVLVRDRQTGVTERVSLSSGGSQSNGSSYDPGVSWDGRYVVFQSEASNLVSGDTNGAEDIFVRDRTLGATTRLSVDAAGGEANGSSSAPSINLDGRYAGFYSVASNLIPGDTNGRQDVFVHRDAGPVGGIAQLPDVSGSSAPHYAPLAMLAAAALALIAAGVWYKGKCLKQG
jgi:Tol biopolymer transport system component